jgi:NDP-sugar pyrophosphorylase family protein
VVQTEGVEIIGFEEKPVSRSRINAGVYALHPDALNSLPQGARCDMPTLFESLQHGARRTVAYPRYEPWLDVGRPEDLQTANSQVG